jgi:hypothetical protein
MSRSLKIASRFFAPGLSDFRLAAATDGLMAESSYAVMLLMYFRHVCVQFPRPQKSR